MDFGFSSHGGILVDGLDEKTMAIHILLVNAENLFKEADYNNKKSSTKKCKHSLSPLVIQKRTINGSE